MTTQYGTIQMQTPNGPVEVPVFAPSDVQYPAWRVQTPQGVGAVDLVDPADAELDFLRVQTPQGVKAVSDSVLPTPKHHYRLDGSGADAASGADLRINGSAWSSTAKEGDSSLHFRGSSYEGDNARQNYGDVSWLDGATSFTLTLWVYLLDSSEYFGIVYDFNNDGYWQNNASGLSLRHNDSPGAGSWAAKMDTDTGGHFTAYGNTTQVGTWTHLAVTYDGSTLELYENATLTGSGSGSGGLAGDGTDPIFGHAASAPGGDDLGAYVDDVRFYDATLTQGQIEQVMNEYK